MSKEDGGSTIHVLHNESLLQCSSYLLIDTILEKFTEKMGKVGFLLYIFL